MAGFVTHSRERERERAVCSVGTAHPAFRTADTHVLRDLWLFTFGDAPVSHSAMCEHLDTDDDIFWVGHELWRRNQIQGVTMRFPDRDETFSGYALVREGESLGDN